MAYDEELAVRVLTIIGAEPSLVRKPMFGGMAYMLLGNLACCVLSDDLTVRVPKDEYALALQQPHVPRDGLLRSPHAQLGRRRPRRNVRRCWSGRVGTARQPPSSCRPIDAPLPRRTATPRCPLAHP